MNTDKIYEIFKAINQTSDKVKIKCLSEYGMSLFNNTSEHFKKCSEDPIFFIENYLKINNVLGGQLPFKLYPKQKEYVNFFLSDTGEAKYVKNTRQTGITSLNCALYAWIFLFQSDKNIVFVSMSQDMAKRCADITMEFIRQFQSTFSHLYEKSNSFFPGRFEISGDNGSRINFLSARQLNSSLKGRSISYAYLDDLEYFDVNFKELLNILYPCFNKNNFKNLMCSSCKKSGTRKNIPYITKSESFFTFDCLDVPTRDSRWIVETIKNIGIEHFENEFLP